MFWSNWPKCHFWGQNLGFKVLVSGQNTLFCMFFTKNGFFCENMELTVQYKGRSGIVIFWKSAFCITRVIVRDNFHYYFELQMSHIGGDFEFSKMCKNIFSMQYCLERNSQKCTKIVFFASFLNKENEFAFTSKQDSISNIIGKHTKNDYTLLEWI